MSYVIFPHLSTLFINVWLFVTMHPQIIFLKFIFEVPHVSKETVPEAPVFEPEEEEVIPAKGTTERHLPHEIPILRSWQ